MDFEVRKVRRSPFTFPYVFTFPIEDYDYHYVLKDPNRYWGKAELSDDVLEWFKENRIFQGMHYQFITGKPSREAGRIVELRFSDEETVKLFNDYWGDRYFPIKFTENPTWEITARAEEWLQENCQHGYLFRSTIVWFRDKTEATLFKLSI